MFNQSQKTGRFGDRAAPIGHFGRALLVALFSLAGLVRGAERITDPQVVKFFEHEVRPLLAEHCYKCHGPKKQSGGLRLDHRSTMLTGGDSGPAIVPGKPQESLLVDAIRYESFEMPPTGQLAAKQIDVLVRWVKLGAPWPGDEAPPKVAAQAEKITDEDRRWWAFQPPRDVPVPRLPDDRSSRNEIDAFIRARLVAEGLRPAAEADRATLARRLYFDLTGLPPRDDELAEFVADDSPEAYAELVDRLLASPRYGERWARSWLDLVRYADSDGYRIDDYRSEAWRYRDYVIRALNSDKPYDRFVEEQLAGDELYPDDPEALVATGYLRNGIYEYNNRDVRGQWEVILNDITDTTGDVFLGLGVQCARCHDHKFDPILQKDYFRLRAFFAGLLPRNDLVAATAAERAEHARKLAAWEAKTADLRRQIEVIEAEYRKKATAGAVAKFPDDIQQMIRTPFSERAPLEHQLAELAYRQVYYEFDRLDRNIKGEKKEKLVALRKQLAAFDALKPAPLPIALAATDAGAEAAPVVIPKKGRELIEPGFLTLLEEQPAVIEKVSGSRPSTGRRSTLAHWLTRPENPLTARVIVNRVWQGHFGRGLAENTSDFGKLGQAPSHPELLDWLAVRFVADGWSLKQLHRRIVLSATYRQAAHHPEMALGQRKDPENRLYWRGSTRRLDAEQIRDAMYAATGELDLRSGGPGEAAEAPRRSIYLRVMRNTRNPLLDVFDAPQWIASAASRDTTTTPVQSLLLINSQLMLKRAEALSEHLEKLEPSASAARIDRAYRLLFGRAPHKNELSTAEQFLAEQAQRTDAALAASVEAKFLYEKVPFRDGRAALINDEQGPLVAPHSPQLPKGDFTIEASFVLRSIYDSGAVRVIAANWTGNDQQPGWSLGVTGKRSRRSPQTLVLQLTGKASDQPVIDVPIFSDQHIQLNKPYYVAATIRLADEKQPGEVTFYVKDLSNDDEPLLVARMPCSVTGDYTNDLPLTIGGRTGQKTSRFDGPIDDVRLSRGALAVEQLLFTTEGVQPQTLGYWRFEPTPDVFADASGHGWDIEHTTAASKGRVDARRQAWIDFCHVLLNSSEFLYVD